MTPQDEYQDTRQDEAVTWFVRLHDSDDEGVWLAHRDWLEAHPANAAAYAAVEATWLDAEGIGADDDTTAGATDGNVVDLAERRSAWSRRRIMAWIPPAIAAALVGMVVQPRIGDLFEASADVYTTGSNTRREVRLADGSVLTLDRNTKLAVRIADDRRLVTLAYGQAAFDVHHDASKPFVIHAGDRQVRVLGTAFDVLLRDKVFGVSVSRGLVSVSAAGAQANVVRLPAGKALIRLPDADGDRISDVAPDNAGAWKSGRLVYLDSTLEAVGRDYERFIGKPVAVRPEVRDLHISGVVNARDEDALIRQLELLLPVRIVKTAGGREIRKR